MKPRDVAIVKRTESLDTYYYEVIDQDLHKHVVQIPKRLLEAAPKHYARGTDQEHLDTLACGVVLSEINPDVRFHSVERESVDRAYHAALKMQSFDRLAE